MNKCIKFFILLFIMICIQGCDNVHIHQLVDGKCSCGYLENHSHEFIDGICSCGERKKTTYKVIWKNELNQTLGETIVLENEIPTYQYNPQDTIQYDYSFEGWSTSSDGEVIKELPPATSDITYYAIVKSTLKEYVMNIYDINNDLIESNTYTYGTIVDVPNPTIVERYSFLGWQLNDEILQWPIKIEDNLNIYAIYEKTLITVGKDKLFDNLQDAVDYAVDGDVIYIDSGIYAGAVINKSIALRGANFDKTPHKQRNDETTFYSDIIINASNVTINGVQLTNTAKITFDNLSCNVDNIKILYCNVVNSTVNANNERNAAPFNLVSNNNYFISNVFIDSCLIAKTIDTRSMVAYIVDVENLTIQNCTFLGSEYKGSYNDAIKIDNAENGNAQFGIKGEVVIKNNYFEDYSQYAIWFREYGDGDYLIKDNTFDSIGQTNDTHAAVNFIKANENIDVSINIINNIINNGYMLLKIDETNNVLNYICNVNENSLLNCKGLYYIKCSESSISINAKNNYYGTAIIDETKFLGNIDYSNYYEVPNDLPGFESLQIDYTTNTNLSIGESYQILYDAIGFDITKMVWLSSDSSIVAVSDLGIVTAVGKGSAVVTVKIEEYNIEESIVFNVFDDISSLSDIAQYILSIMNNYSFSVTAANSRTNYGVTNPYLYSIYRSATLYLFEDLDINTESYKRDGEAKLINGKVEYITIHDTWALQRDAKGLAEYFQKDITSVHYTVGNDGIYQIVRLTDKGAHAGDSPYRAYSLDKTNVLATTDNPVITMNDGYFVINGIQTNLRPYIDYDGTVQDMNNYTTEQITYSGIRCLIGDDGYYYLGKTYFNETYKTISNFGGNANSIGIEMASQKGTDFYLNMHKTAKLVAMLMNMFNLTTNDVKMHNYFSGKNCAQLLKNNLKYEYNYQIDKHNMEDTLWDEFLDMCDAELMMLKFSEKYNVEFISSNTDLLSNKGQVIDHKDKDTVVSYVIKITNIETGEIEEINSSILIPSSNKIDECYIKR